jgi:hypothetical protein
LILTTSCNVGTSNLSEGEYLNSDTLDLISNKIIKCKRLLKDFDVQSFNDAKSELQELNTLLTDELKINFKDDILEISKLIDNSTELSPIELINLTEFYANEGSHERSFIGLKGDTIQVKLSCDKPFSVVSIIEERSGRVIKKFWNNILVDYNFVTFTDNVYTLKITFSNGAYLSCKISKIPIDLSSKFAKYKIQRDSVRVQKKTRRSIMSKEIKFESVYNEPKKFILSGALRSGASKIYAPIRVPKKCKEFIYRLRISGDEDKIGQDGNLINEVSSSYRKIKVLGLPVWESNKTSSSLTRELFNLISDPMKEEDYTANIFFFNNESEVKKFVSYNGVDFGNAFKYDLKNSALGSQSRNGLVKSPKLGYSYLGLNTNSNFSNTHIWLDVVALYESEFHYEIRKKIKR